MFSNIIFNIYLCHGHKLFLNLHLRLSDNIVYKWRSYLTINAVSLTPI